MRVRNETEADGGAFAEMVRLQTEFHAKLADETLRYLSRLGGRTGLSSLGTVIPTAEGLAVKASGQPGRTVPVALEVENLQRVYCVVLPQLTPLVSQTGATWL